MSDVTERELTVDAAEQGMRADRWLAQQLEISRRRAAKLIQQGKVSSGRRKLSKAQAMATDMHVSVTLSCSRARPQVDAELDVRLERDDLLIVHKPSGQPTVPLDGDETDTLANAVVGRFPECAGVGYGPLEPGLVHRLDTGTSGLLMVARARETFDALRGELTAGRIDKRYLAIVHGHPAPRLTIDRPLGPHPKSRRRVQVLTCERAGSHPARTAVQLVEAKAELSLVELRVSRAYRHQIRAHLASAGFPIAGDAVYGRADSAPRLALHASHIAYSGGSTREFAVSAPLPIELSAWLASAS